MTERKITETIIGQTPLDKDFRQDLIPKHITLLSELNEYEAKNIEKASQKYLVGDAKKWDLTIPKIIEQIHKDMYGDVWIWAGKNRKRLTNIGILPEQIVQALEELRRNLQFWIQNNTYKNNREMAVIFHHKLVRIHPFPNGNGRLARFCADILVRQRDENPIAWSRLLSDSTEERKKYIAALKEADSGKLKLLSAYWND